MPSCDRSLGRSGGLLLAAWLALCGAASAADFRVGEVDGLANLTLAYGVLVRTEDADERLVATANGGRDSSANRDDATLNYDRGIASQMLQATGELTLRWRNFGAYARGIAFYDYEHERRDRERTQLDSSALRLVGKDAELHDYYVNAQFTPGGLPLQLRVGNQVINWGESAFLRQGIEVINPVDLVTAFRPTATVRDLFVPQGMVWAAANVTETVALEAFYQYDWEPVPLPPVGSLFSSLDPLGGDGLAFAMLGGGRFSDLGTDLDEAFGLPAGTLGFDPDFMKIPGAGRQRPSNQGQYGFAVQAILPRLNSTKVGLHFVNYHSRLPLLGARTPGAAAVAASSAAAVGARAAALAPIYESTGLSPAEAQARAGATASQLTLSGFANQAGYFVEYPEDIQMLGLTMNTATLGTGTLVSAELSLHLDAPVQIPVDVVLGAALSPIGFTSALGQGPLGSFSADQIVEGFVERDRLQAALGVTQLLGPRLGATQTLVAADLGWIRIDDLPDELDLDERSWGYRVLAQMSFDGILGGVSLRPAVLFTHHVDGVTPGPLSAFDEGRKSLTFAIELEYNRSWLVDLNYTSFFGGGSDNDLRDRDFVSFAVRYFY